MSFMPWSEAYRLDVAVLDNDHRVVLEDIGRLSWLVDAEAGEEAGDDAILSALTSVIDAIDSHFEREESLMVRHTYPYHLAHRDQHRVLSRDLFAVRKLFAAAPDSIDMPRVLQFLQAWWHNHILRSDAMLVTYLGTAAHGSVLSDGWSLTELERLSVAVDGESHQVTLVVPAEHVDTLHTCARLLRRGGSDADQLSALAHPLTTMTLGEAAVIAKRLMR